MQRRKRGISHLPTASGYRFDEVFSSLQKSIRRADEEGAMYWAIELEEDFNPHLWNRLEVISHEDVGIVSMDVIMFVRTCKEQYMECKKRGSGSNRLMLSNAILALCRAEKTRLADSFNIHSYRRLASERREIPDIAKDKHTQAGRKLGRGFDHFFTEATQLQQPNEDNWLGADPYEESAKHKSIHNVPRVGDLKSEFNKNSSDVQDTLF